MGLEEGQRSRSSSRHVKNSYSSSQHGHSPPTQPSIALCVDRITYRLRKHHGDFACILHLVHIGQLAYCHLPAMAPSQPGDVVSPSGIRNLSRPQIYPFYDDQWLVPRGYW